METTLQAIVDKMYDMPDRALPIRLVFDVDGVICDNRDLSKDYGDRPPFLYAIQRINDLKGVKNHNGVDAFHRNWCHAYF